MNSAQTGRERRRLPRAVFSAEENLTAVARFTSQEDRHKEFKVMDISRGGIGLAIRRAEVDEIHTGGRLFLEEINIGIAEKKTACTLAMEVAWVMDHEFLDNVGMGCKFIETRQGDVEDLITFINKIFPGRIF